MSDIHTALLKNLRATIHKTFEEHPKELGVSVEDHFIHCVQITVAVMATELGYLSGVAALGGIPMAQREAVIAQHLRLGKQIALEEHDAAGNCLECDAAVALKSELEAN